MEIDADLLLGRTSTSPATSTVAWAGRGRRYPDWRTRRCGCQPLINASGALAALESLRDRLPVTAQAVRNGLAMVELPARFQIVPGQPALVLDVAHNPHAVAALAANLDAMGFYPTTHAVFGAMGDKDLAVMLRTMGPLVDRWYFTDLPTPRAESALRLPAAMAGAGTRRRRLQTHATAGGLQCAVAAQTPLIEFWSSDRSTRWGAY